MLPFYFDSSLIILIPGLILAMYAQFKVQSTFARYLRVRAASGYTGAQVAAKLLEEAGINDVNIEQTGGHLSDHYDPKKKALRLSQEVYNGSSLASLGVAAHETGHAIQHHNDYLPLNIRANLVPVAQFGSFMAFPIFFIGLIFQSGWMLSAGIYLFTAVVLFQIVTLPVEFNASSRALVGLEKGGYISRAEVGGTKKVLNAAALTYVAAVLMSVLQLVRLLLISRDD
ncbi:zinc metallopeptidase [Phosphitispora sp. TUW77]|uniref:zinc metallopeptidase n=1 Tax=Phosphitispora sp. TUW77 TaxID=3152361 RepID=UPI003AB82B70